MYTLFSILIIITCILLVLIIMIQNPKGGGLSSTFGGGGSQMMGVQKTTDFLDKSTWALAVTLLALTLLSNFAVERGGIIEQETELQEQINEANFIPKSDIPINDIQKAPITNESKEK